MKKILVGFISLFVFMSTYSQITTQRQIAQLVKQNENFAFVKQKALEVVAKGLNAGDGYGEVWIRDFNTFIELAMDTLPADKIKENLMVFFKFQGVDGNIQDGFIHKKNVLPDLYEYFYSPLDTIHAGHKNTVETDQETSLVQAIYKYVKTTNDRSILHEKIGGETVTSRIVKAMYYLLDHRYSYRYGLIWGATTMDWGDIQPEHDWGVYLTSDTHYSIDIYDNAMFIIALDNLMELIPSLKVEFKALRDQIAINARKYLWDNKNKKFIPHIYLNGTPFPANWDENQVFYHGGTAVAIEAGLLSNEEIKLSLDKMITNMTASGAATIGLTVYPPYPSGYFKSKDMHPYNYQNGGDWTWFGGRMIQQLLRYNFLDEAYVQLLPMIERVKTNNGFYEWYTEKNVPKGSGTFRGEAGVLYKAIRMIEE